MPELHGLLRTSIVSLSELGRWATVFYGCVISESPKKGKGLKQSIKNRLGAKSDPVTFPKTPWCIDTKPSNSFNGYGNTVDVEDKIVGTSKDLEKRYLRLTSVSFTCILKK